MLFVLSNNTVPRTSFLFSLLLPLHLFFTFHPLFSFSPAFFLVLSLTVARVEVWLIKLQS